MMTEIERWLTVSFTAHKEERGEKTEDIQIIWNIKILG